MVKKATLFLLIICSLNKIYAQNYFVINGETHSFDLSVEQYGLYSIGFDDYRNVLPLIYPYWNIQGYSNDFFMMISFNYNWYFVRKFVFKHSGISLSNGIEIGSSYEDIKNTHESPYLELAHPIHGKTKTLYYGKEHIGYGSGIALSDMILFFNEENILTEIHINIVSIEINEDINDILINEWKTVSTSYPQWKLQFTDDYKFIFTYKLDVNEDYLEDNGVWQLIYNDNLPEVELTFLNKKRIRRYSILKTREKRFAIQFGADYFFYP